MNFLQFAVWGAYLTSIGNYLGASGMGDLIPWFYAIQGMIFCRTIRTSSHSLHTYLLHYKRGFLHAHDCP